MALTYSKFETWLPVAVGVIGLGVTFLVGSLYFHDKRQILIAETEDATAIATLQIKQILATLAIAYDFIELELNRTGSFEEVDLELETVRENLPNLRTMIVVDPEGIVRNETRPGKPALGADITDRSYFQDALSAPFDFLHLGQVVVSRVDGRRTIPMSRAVTNSSGDVIAVIATSTGAEFFASVEGEQNLAVDTDLFLFEPEHDVLAALNHDASDTPSRRVVSEFMASCNCESSDETLPKTLVFDNYVISIDTAEKRRLFMIAARPLSNITLNAWNAAQWPTLLGLVGTVIATALVTLFLRQGQEIRERDQTFANVAENIPGAVFHYTLNADGSDRVDSMSKGCEAIWEMTAKEIGNDPTPLWKMVDPDDLKTLQADVQQSAKTLEPWSSRWGITAPSGAHRILHGRGRPEALADGGTRWTSLVLDVTDRFKAEAALKESREMILVAQKREAIGQLTGGVAHDFNNLLAVIKGNLELVEELDLDTEAADLLGEVSTAADQSVDLTRRLLLLGRKAVLEPQLVDLNQSVADMQKLLRRTLPETISIETTLKDDPIKVRVDPAQVESAILNLAVNARDAMPDGGHLILQVSVFKLAEPLKTRNDDTLLPGEYAVLTVRDNGTGMTPEVLQRAIDPYFTTKAAGEGSGLGLAVVHGFMKQSDGGIEINSKPGTGTTIHLFFPVATGQFEKESDPVKKPEITSLRVLLVEDMAQVRRTTARVLKSFGIEVVEAENGQIALELFRNAGQFDAVVTDVVMPGGLTGLQLMEEIRKTAPRMPAIFMSGYFNPDAADMHENGELDHFLSKPATKSDIGSALARLLGS